MPQVTTGALILQVFAYGETSRILRLLTASHGVQSAIAKGVRRPRSQFAGLMEPFAEGTATLYIKESRDLQTLAGFELTRSRQALGRDLVRFAGASLLAEILLRTVGVEPNPELFESVTAALDRVEGATSAATEAVVLGEAWQLVAALGFAPALDGCLECAREIAVDEDVTFDYAAGGIRCDECARAAPGRRIPGRALAALRAMLQGGDVRIDRTQGHWWLLERFLDHHVLEGSPLRSFAFLSEALEASSCPG
jgi:DNA repair protein RecO (recombination protein O)